MKTNNIYKLFYIYKDFFQLFFQRLLYFIHFQVIGRFELKVNVQVQKKNNAKYQYRKKFLYSDNVDKI